MPLKTLKKAHLDDAGAFTDQSSGKDSLRDVLADMAKAGPTLTAIQATIATADILNAIVLPFDVLLTSLVLFAGEWGSAGSTVINVNDVAGVLKAVTVDNAVADETTVTTPLDIVVLAGTPIFFEVDTAPTAGTDLIATLTMQPVKVAA